MQRHRGKGKEYRTGREYAKLFAMGQEAGAGGIFLIRGTRGSRKKKEAEGSRLLVEPVGGNEKERLRWEKGEKGSPSSSEKRNWGMRGKGSPCVRAGYRAPVRTIGRKCIDKRFLQKGKKESVNAQLQERAKEERGKFVEKKEGDDAPLKMV